MDTYVTAGTFIALVGLGLFFVIRQLTRLNKKITTEQGVQVASFPDWDTTSAALLVRRLAEHGIKARALSLHEFYGLTNRRKTGVFVDEADAPKARETLSAWDDEERRLTGA